MERNDRTFTITLSGWLADAGPLDIGVIFPVVSDFHAALREMIRHLWGVDADTGRPGRLSDALRAASALKLVSIDHGSYAMTIEIAEPWAAPSNPFTRRDRPAETIPDAPLAGLNALLTGAAADIDGLPAKVSGHLQKMQSRLPEGIDAIRVSDNAARVAFTIERRRHRRRQGRRGQITLYGRLQEIDWARRSAELHSHFGVIKINFREDLSESMRDAARKFVEITGTGTIGSDGLITSIAMSGISQLGESPYHVDIPTAVHPQRAGQFNPMAFEHPDRPDDEMLDAWVDTILGEKDNL